MHPAVFLIYFIPPAVILLLASLALIVKFSQLFTAAVILLVAYLALIV